jgi:hypothetical protein
VRCWNLVALPEQTVELEHVEECLLSHARWQCAIANGEPPDARDDYLARHQEFAKRVPDALLLILTDDECDDDDCI